MAIRSLDPATGNIVREFDEITDAALDARIARAAAAQEGWRLLSVPQRAVYLDAAANILDERRDSLAGLISLEMGKPVRAARDEIAKCALALRYYVANGPELLRPKVLPSSSGEMVSVEYAPLGVVFAVMPWNFPFWQVFRFAAPALAAGNCALLKHASNVPQCGIAIEELFREAGFPDGVFQNLLLPASRVEGVIADSRIAAVTLTGSEGAGAAVGAAAGRNLKKSVLELGGSDPFIVLSSARLADAAAAAAGSRTVNAGQSCIAAKRFIVTESVAEEFIELFIAEMSRLRVGDPRSEEIDVGPLATEQVLIDVERQLSESLRMGGQIACGGTRNTGAGFFFPPTVVLNPDSSSPLWTEEVFGPVAPVMRVPDRDSALRVANDSKYGLGASVWTSSTSDVELFSRELRCGMVFVNSIVQSDPRYPFGGIRRSGHGRELGQHGLMEFVNAKTVRVRAVPRAE